MNWYYVKDGQRLGPVEENALRGLAASGALQPKDLVWNETMGDQWSPASSVPGLFGMAAAPIIPAVGGPTGETPNRDLMARARASLKGQWGSAIAVSIIYLAITMSLSFLPYGIGTLATY